MATRFVAAFSPPKSTASADVPKAPTTTPMVPTLFDMATCPSEPAVSTSASAAASAYMVVASSERALPWAERARHGASVDQATQVATGVDQGTQADSPVEFHKAPSATPSTCMHPAGWRRSDEAQVDEAQVTSAAWPFGVYGQAVEGCGRPSVSFASPAPFFEPYPPPPPPAAFAPPSAAVTPRPTLSTRKPSVPTTPRRSFTGCSSSLAQPGDVDLTKLAARAMRAKMMGNMAEHERLSRRLASAGVSEPFEQTARARFISTEPTMHQPAMHHPAMYRPAMYPARCRTAAIQAGGAGVLGRIGAAASSHPLEAFDHMTLATLGLACMWHDEDGKQARARLWKACDAPSSTGRISAADLDRWVRAALGCPARFVTRPTTSRIFEAAKEQLDNSWGREPRLSTYGIQGAYGTVLVSGAAGDYVEPGVGFWRLCLLVHCYLELYLRFHSPDAEAHFVEEDELLRVATFLRRWGASALSAEQARAEFERMEYEYGHTVFFHELLDWAMRWLLKSTAPGASGSSDGFPFKELERLLTAQISRPDGLRPAAKPLTML